MYRAHGPVPIQDRGLDPFPTDRNARVFVRMSTWPKKYHGAFAFFRRTYLLWPYATRRFPIDL
jgi:hypothetical protein